MEEWNRGKWIFKDIHGYGYPYYHIHPYKQKVVREIVEYLPDWVEGVIVFGSAIHPSHMWWNDLDICVIGHRQRGKSVGYHGVDCDILYLKSLEDLVELAEFEFNSIYYNIKQDGVLVYE